MLHVLGQGESDENTSYSNRIELLLRPNYANSKTRIADRRAIAIANACLAYRAKYYQYPAELKDLLPAFLPSVPVAKRGGEHFRYSRSLDPDRGPMLYYAAVPLFGRRFYHMDSGGWRYLD